MDSTTPQDPATRPAEGLAGGGLAASDLAAAQRLREAYQRLRSELGRVIVGQEEVIEQLLVALCAQGHCLLEGVPGLAKTLLVSTLARCLRLQFNRIQFTPDLTPSDVTGTEVLQEDRATGKMAFKFLRGPVFANIVLADEINRTPPKTQAALLEAMQERQVTAGGQRHVLPSPFFVLATQNPIEQEGTYALPEAQQDRFMFKVFVRYPTYDEEYRIVEATTAPPRGDVGEVLSAEDLLEFQELVRRVPAAPNVLHYALRLVRGTRVYEGESHDFALEWVSWGAGPRAAQYLILGAKARALLHGRWAVTRADIQALAHPVLRHRILTNYNAESSGITSDKVIDRLLAETPEQMAGDEQPPLVARALGQASSGVGPRS
ncbi:MAG: MoxR family ATPase [Pirellulales bacterium]